MYKLIFIRRLPYDSRVETNKCFEQKLFNPTPQQFLLSISFFLIFFKSSEKEEKNSASYKSIPY
jgi:hypothetical protein